MIHGLSSHLIVGHELTLDWLDRVSGAGFELVEIFCARHSFDYRNRSRVSNTASWFRGNPLKLNSLHMPMYSDFEWGRSGSSAVVNIAELEPLRRRDSVDEIKRALEVAEEIPCRYAIQHIGVGREQAASAKLDAACRSLEELNAFARDRGVEILIENIPNELSSAAGLLRFVESTGLGNGFCFDTGHAHIMEGVEAAFHTMRHRIRSTHVHDNDGVNDIHLFPYLAENVTIDWRRAMALLRSRPGQFPLMLELRESASFPDSIAAVRQVLDRLENERPLEEEA
jgi:sugar phosphate isomerase/epimerase